MFAMFDSFDAYETFDPLPLVTPLRVVLQEGNSRELQTTFITANRGLVTNHFIHSSELDSLL